MFKGNNNRNRKNNTGGGKMKCKRCGKNADKQKINGFILWLCHKCGKIIQGVGEWNV
jgi:ribosomal protein L37AE/L43A